MSIHHPSQEFIDSNDPVAGITHSYQDTFTTKDIFYFSDGRGLFRFGNPLESEAFENRRSIHLLIHPIWWVLDGETPQAKAEVHARHYTSNYLAVMEQNCKPFQATYVARKMGLSE